MPQAHAGKKYGRNPDGDEHDCGARIGLEHDQEHGQDEIETRNDKVPYAINFNVAFGEKFGEQNGKRKFGKLHGLERYAADLKPCPDTADARTDDEHRGEQENGEGVESNDCGGLRPEDTKINHAGADEQYDADACPDELAFKKVRGTYA